MLIAWRSGSADAPWLFCCAHIAGTHMGSSKRRDAAERTILGAFRRVIAVLRRRFLQIPLSQIREVEGWGDDPANGSASALRYQKKAWLERRLKPERNRTPLRTRR